MSVAVTKLKSGISVVTDTMPHLETASLGVWVNSGSRDERHDEHGISHFLEHMAFKGTRRRTARQIAEEIEAVGGDLNAATSVESTAYFARVLKADVPLAIDVLADILSEPAFARDEIYCWSRTSSCRRSARSPTRPTIWSSNICRPPPFPSNRSAVRSLARRRRCARSTARSCATISAGTTAGRTWSIAAAGAVNHEAVVAEVEKRFASFNGPAGPAPEPARFGGGAHIEKRKLEQVHIALALPGLRAERSAALLAADVQQRAWRRHVVPAVPGGARKARPVLLDLLLSCLVFGCRHVRPLCRHRRRRRLRADAPGRRRDRQCHRRPFPRRRLRAPRRR